MAKSAVFIDFIIQWILFLPTYFFQTENPNLFVCTLRPFKIN
ncbi:MAG: hypothetical protein CM15mP23_01750 [Cryomorphaceae bacterium]|nr:MAG: hypothetical protein CM15mP23_01750 [Cryomorphaceae bacterium]